MKNNYATLKFIALVLSIQPLAAASQMVGNGGLRLNEFREADGSLIKSGSETGIVGTPMLQEGWAIGTIKYKNGKTLSDSAINYSLYTNKLYLKLNEIFIELSEPAEAFSLTFQSEDGTTVRHQFKSGYPAINDLNENSYYDIYYDGKNIQLLIRPHKKVVEIYTYGGPYQKSYSLVEDLYLYDKAEKKMIPIKSFSPDALKKTIPGYTANIDSYCSSHKLSSKNREQFVGLLSFLDSN